jgi:hypothetical protein
MLRHVEQELLLKGLDNLEMVRKARKNIYTRRKRVVRKDDRCYVLY